MDGFRTRFALASLAVWRVAHLLAEEDGPFDSVAKLRRRAGAGQLGALMDCFYCLSMWVAAPAAVAVAPRRRDAPFVALALSGAACLVERATAVSETEGANDGVLWEETEDRQRQADAREPDRRHQAAAAAGFTSVR